MPDSIVDKSAVEANRAQLYDILVAHLTDFAVFLTDPDGWIVSWNPGVERILGYSEPEWLGQSLRLIFTPEDQSKGIVELEIETAKAKGQAPDVRWHVSKGDRRLFIEGTLVALRDDGGQLLGFSKVMRDITNRKEREQQLEDALEYAEGIVNTVSEPLLVLDTDLRIRSANRSFHRMFHLSKEETENQLLSELNGGGWNNPQLGKLLSELAPKCAEPEAVEMEFDFPVLGQKVMVLNAGRLWREGHRTELTLLAITDVTHGKQAERALAESEKQLRLIMDTAPALISYVDRNLRYRLANAVYERWFGIAPDDVVGKHVSEVFDTSLLSTLQPNIDRVLAGETVCFEETYPRIPEGCRILEVTYTPDFDERGDVQGFMVLGNDTTARKETDRALRESERRQAALATLGDQLRDLRDMASLTLAAMGIVGNAMDVARTGYGQVDLAQESVTLGSQWSNGQVPALPEIFRFKDFSDHLGDHLRNGETIAVADVSTDPITAKECERWKALDVHAFINLPLIENGKLVAILFVQDSAPRSWTEADLTFVHKVADRTWAAAERARTLKELQESEEFNRSVLASTPDCVKIVDVEGRLLTMNEGGCRQMEIDDFGVCRNQPWSQFWGETKEVAEQAMTEARQGRTARFEGFCPTAKGTPKWWEVVVTPILDGSGKPVRILSLSRDITERKGAEKEREWLTGELKRSNEELAQFAHIVAHDLQSPLRGVMSFSQLLQRNARSTLTEEQLRNLDQIIENSHRMQELVQALLRFAQVGQGVVTKKPVEMDAVAAAAVQSLQTQIEEQAAHIKVDPLPLVAGDSVQLLQLLQNLIGNALKYRRAEVQSLIKVRAVKQDQVYEFAVEDNGEGIAAAYVQKVFEPLHRLHGSDVPGSGLGLAICQRIVNRHGGRIWVESTIGVGSTFRFTLPGV